MDNNSYQCRLNVSASPETIFACLTKDINKWWTTSAEDASVVNSKATFRFGDTYNTMLVKALSKDTTVIWECLDQNHVDDNVSIANEWVGTELIWTIVPSEVGAVIEFTHQGLIPSMECYEICNTGWNHFILDSLKSYLESGTGKPFIHEG